MTNVDLKWHNKTNSEVRNVININKKYIIYLWLLNLTSYWNTSFNITTKTK